MPAAAGPSASAFGTSYLPALNGKPGLITVNDSLCSLLLLISICIQPIRPCIRMTLYTTYMKECECPFFLLISPKLASYCTRVVVQNSQLLVQPDDHRPALANGDSAALANVVRQLCLGCHRFSRAQLVDRSQGDGQQRGVGGKPGPSHRRCLCHHCCCPWQPRSVPNWSVRRNAGHKLQLPVCDSRM